jgi:predicted RNA-binding protein with EMAP domain
MCCENMNTGSNDWISLIGTILIPIIIGFITYIIAKKQITNTGITQFRQQWINSLRDTLSLFIARVEYTIIQEDNIKIKEAFHEMVEAKFKAEMLLNPNEDDHNALVKKMQEIRHMVYEDESVENKIDDEVEKLLTISKRVLKREWNVVKKGK